MSCLRRGTSCTPEDLKELLKTKGHGVRGYKWEFPSDPYNEVCPGLFVGDGATAETLEILKDLAITHVLNAAWGFDRVLGFVSTSPSFYEKVGIEFLGIQADDVPHYNMIPHFRRAADFMEKALNSKGRVYVHCKMGISRSATLAIAFLMLKRNMSVQEAVTTVRSRRAILPNDGFLNQLCLLNDELYSQRHQ